MADDEDARPRRRRGPDRVGVHPGGADDTRARPLGDEREQQLDRAVLVLGREDLVAGGERERAEDGVHPGSRVEDEGEVVRGRPDVRPERLAHIGELAAEPPLEQVDRLPLELALPLLIDVEHRSRARAERAVVEVDDLRIEQEQVARRHARAGSAASLAASARHSRASSADARADARSLRCPRAIAGSTSLEQHACVVVLRVCEPVSGVPPAAFVDEGVLEVPSSVLPPGRRRREDSRALARRSRSTARAAGPRSGARTAAGGRTRRPPPPRRRGNGRHRQAG